MEKELVLLAQSDRSERKTAAAWFTYNTNKLSKLKRVPLRDMEGVREMRSLIEIVAMQCWSAPVTLRAALPLRRRKDRLRQCIDEPDRSYAPVYDRNSGSSTGALLVSSSC